MADNLLFDIDEALAGRSAKVLARRAHRLKTPASDPETDVFEDLSVSSERYGWIEAFIALQFLWGVFVFIPGAQPFRAYIRALPYLTSLGMFGLYAMTQVRGMAPAGSVALFSALGLLLLNLLHPTSQMTAGLAQCIFQLSIAVPLLWAPKAIASPGRFQRLLLLIFIMNALSAGLGILQVYYPDRFMPPEFNSLGLQLNQYYVDGLSYLGSGDRTIIRPPGLTDQPGGAAIAGALTAVLGISFLLRASKPWQMATLVGVITVGLAVIYLTQVRSVLVVSVGSAALLCAVALRRGRIRGALGGLLALGALVVASFSWASSVGGTAVDERFLDLRSGVVQKYQENRGDFLSETTGDLLDRYPLGAGVGRWGMMNTYFGDPHAFKSEPIHVEIQLTGWLLDGGLPMWFLYGSALALSLLASFRLTATPGPLSHAAMAVLAIQALVVAIAMAGPAFNTQLGILFWTLAGALHGAVKIEQHTQEFGEE